MAECGDRYANLVRSAAGATPEDPCAGTLINECIGGDAESWRLGTDSMRSRVQRFLERLIKTMRAKGVPLPDDGAPSPTWMVAFMKAVRDAWPQYAEVEDYTKEYDELPGWAWPPWGAKVGLYIANQKQGACALELIATEIDRLGGTPPEATEGPPPPPPGFLGTLGRGLLVAAGIGAVLWGTWKIVKISRAREAGRGETP